MVGFGGGLVAPSGIGKTNILLNLIELSKDMFAKIVVHKVEEPLYDMLSNDILPNDVVFITDLDDLPKPDELAEHLGLRPKDQILVVFDDCMADKHQDMITRYYIRGRKSNISSFYLS